MDCPAVTVAVAGAAATPKLVTVTCTACCAEPTRVLLLADTVVVLVPKGQLIVEPDPEQPPVAEIDMH